MARRTNFRVSFATIDPRAWRRIGAYWPKLAIYAFPNRWCGPAQGYPHTAHCDAKRAPAVMVVVSTAISPVTMVLPAAAARKSFPHTHLGNHANRYKNELKCQISPFINLVRECEIKHFELKLAPKSILSIYASSGIGAAIGVIVSVIVGGFVYLVQYAQNMDFLADARFINFGIFILDLKICLFVTLAAFSILLLRKLFNITKWNGPAGFHLRRTSKP
jgi:CIC family chloride channel protein